MIGGGRDERSAVEDVKNRSNGSRSLSKVGRHTPGLGNNLPGAHQYKEGLENISRGNLTLLHQPPAEPKIQGPRHERQTLRGPHPDPGRPRPPRPLPPRPLLRRRKQPQHLSAAPERRHYLVVPHCLRRRLRALRLGPCRRRRSPR